MINITKFFYRTTYVKNCLFTTNMFFYTLNNINSMDSENLEDNNNKIKYIENEYEKKLFKDIENRCFFKSSNINDKIKSNKPEEKSSENIEEKPSEYNLFEDIENKLLGDTEEKLYENKSFENNDIFDFNDKFDPFQESRFNINYNFNLNRQIAISNLEKNINLKTNDNPFIGEKRKRVKLKTTPKITEYTELNENHKILHNFFSKYLCHNLNGCTNNKKCNKTLDITKYLNVEENILIKDNTEKDKYLKILNDIEKGEKIFIQSDTEGRFSNILFVLKRIGIINTEKTWLRYYNFLNGKFQTDIDKDIPHIPLNLFEVISNFKGGYYHVGDWIDRCGSKYHECLLSLLFLIYLKQELPNNVNLICGNHELSCYLEKESSCCSDIKPLLTHIVFKAIANGQIKFFDEVKLGKETYILTHKVIYTDDISRLSRFIFNYQFLTLKKNKNIKKSCNPKCCYEKSIKNLALLENKKDINYNTELTNIKSNVILENNIFIIMENINKLFKLHFMYYFAEIYPKKKCFNNLTDFVNKMYIYSNEFNILNPNKDESIMDGTRVKIKGYENCINNQIAGHDHHPISDYFIKEKNLYFVDNCSHITYNHKLKNLATLHIFNKENENDTNYIQIMTSLL